ncbi:MAG: ribbon-helix-helix protein, CopG family [Chloroflexota bacterium]
MRTTLKLDEDVTAAVEQVRREQGLGMSAAVNRLIRAGLAKPDKRPPYRHRTARLGIKVDVSNIGEVLDLLDEA